MSCHDGITAIAVGTLLNPPGSGQPIVTTSGLRSLGDLYYLTNNWIPSNAYPGNPNLGGDTGPVGALDPSLNPYSGYAVDLSNDHPVSFAWPTDAILLGGLNPVAGIDKKLRLFGIGNRIECSTCHNVHNNAIPPFLAVSNDNSYMCLQCHNK
jgi:predicted CXXCH cytochrome family protein